MRTYALFILTLLTVAGRSQNTINNYKYVLVPQRFDFLKQDDQYGLNNTTKLLLEQKGFTVFWTSGDLPQSLAANRCSALVTEVTQRKAMFSTNLTVVLKDCSGNIIFKSREGKSREKEYFIAYDHALRDALLSLNDVPYKYDSTLSAQSQSQAQPQPQSQSQSQAQPQPQSQSQPQPQPQQPAATPAATPAAAPATLTAALYAQPIPNGYQLVDTTPKKVLTLLKTSIPDYFLAQAGSSNGVVFKKDGEWFFEYYKDDKLVSQKLDIKF